MIEVEVKLNSRTLLATIRMRQLDGTTGTHADYSIEFGIDTGGGTVAVYQRTVVNFPRKEYNVIGLLTIALQTLDERELRLDGDFEQEAGPPDLAREIGRALRAL